MTEPLSGSRRLVEPLVGLLRRAQVNRAVLFGVITYGWRFLAGPLTVILIGTYFSKELQGYYYTFSSLLALQVFVELGLANVVTQFASHEWSQLQMGSDGAISGSPAALSRLVSLGRLAFRWYIAAGTIVAVGVGLWGLYFFSRSPTEGVHWVMPWLSLCVLTGANLALLPVFSLLLGCNQVSQVYAFRMVQGVLTQLAMWAALVMGAGLWITAVAQAVVLVCAVHFLARRYRKFLQLFRTPAASGAQIDWFGEVWPMQWKVAVSFISGYFTNWIFTPLLFQTAGPVAAGQFGMTMTLVSAAAGVAGMWSVPRAPQFGVLLAKRAYAEADRLLSRTWVVSSLVLVAGTMAAWLLVFLLDRMGYALGARMVSPMAAALMALSAIGNAFCVPASVYLRAHKKEPYMWSSLVVGLLTAAAAWLAGARWGILGVAAASAAVNLLVALPWGVLIFIRRRAEWNLPLVPAS